MALLKLENVTVNYGSINALSGINLEVNEGEIVTLIGSNGAGKSTTMRTIMGLKHCDGGKIFFNGEDITNKDTRAMVQKSIILSPEGRQVFPRFSVEDNLRMGAYTRPDQEIPETMEQVFQLFPKLRDRRKQIAGTLSGGEQQMLAISRAIMARPTLLLLDEPSLGLAPIIIQQIFSIIEKINADGTTVFLVEQNANQALRIANRAYVMENGRIVMEDSADKLLTDPAVQKAYLGM